MSIKFNVSISHLNSLPLHQGVRLSLWGKAASYSLSGSTGSTEWHMALSRDTRSGSTRGPNSWVFWPGLAREGQGQIQKVLGGYGG